MAVFVGVGVGVAVGVAVGVNVGVGGAQTKGQLRAAKTALAFAHVKHSERWTLA